MKCISQFLYKKILQNIQKPYRLDSICFFLFTGGGAVFFALCLVGYFSSSIFWGILLLFSAIVFFSLFFPCLPFPIRLVSGSLKAIVKTVLVLPLLGCTIFWRPRQEEKKLLDRKGNVPVLFLHGFFAFENFWYYHFYRLQKEGVKNLFTVQLGNPLTPIESCADLLRKRIEEIAQMTGCRSIRLVCHSMGGVTALYYIKHLQKQTGIHVSLCITIGSPLKGTLPAPILSSFFPPCKQIEYKDPFVRSLHGDDTIFHTPFVHFYSRVDWVVWPHRSSFPYISKKRKVIAFEDVGHIQTLFSDRVADQLVYYLAR